MGLATKLFGASKSVSAPKASNPAASASPMHLGLEVKEDGKGAVLLTVVPPELPAAGSRTHLDLCIVLDVSGSMGDAANPNGAEEVKLFSKMDLAKRGAEVIARALGANDTLTLVAFSSQVRKVLPRTRMDSVGVDRALTALGALSPGGGTALWDGLHAGLHEVEGSLDDCPAQRTRVCIILTDGQPSPSPPAGEVAELKKYMAARDAAGRAPAKLVTIGFGYDVNSKLLVDLAHEHGSTAGGFNFIPDGTMLLTNFVNLMANLQSTAARSAVLTITPAAASSDHLTPTPDVIAALERAFTTPAGAAAAAGSAAGPHPNATVASAGGAAGGLDIPSLVRVEGEAVWSPIELPGASGARGLQVRLGDVLFGQARHVVLRAAAAGADPSITAGLDWRDWDLKLSYEPAVEGFGCADSVAGSAGEVQGATGPSSVDLAGVTLQLHRALAVSAITQAARMAAMDLTAAHKLVKDAALATMAAQSGGAAAVPGFASPHPILEDLLGEVAGAVGGREAWDKWGSHYLRSLVAAHRAEACNNFKDPGVLAYGGAFSHRRRDELNEMCDSLPVPTPSICPYGTAYGTPVSNITVTATTWRDNFNNARGGCFGAGTRVLLADGVTTKPVEQLRKGDRVHVPGGASARVVCVISYGGVQAVRLPVSGLVITPWHPVRRSDATRAWAFPADLVGEAAAAAGLGAPTPALLSAYTLTPSAVFNLVLDAGHVVSVEGVEAVTLGHGFTEAVVAHPFFGTSAVVEELSRLPGWEAGWVELSGGAAACVVDAASGLVCGLRGAEAEAVTSAAASAVSVGSA